MRGERGYLSDRSCAPQYEYAPLYLAVERGHAAVVEKLLAAGADMKANDQVSK